jgi:hypothetical protein
MTEDAWNTCTDPQAMLEFLQGTGRASQRKLRLVAVACCEGVLDWLEDGRARTAVGVAWRFADSLVSPEELAAAYADAEAAFYGTARRVGNGDATFDARAVPAYFAAYAVTEPDAGLAACSAAAMSAAEGLWDEAAEVTQRRQADLLREVFGTPSAGRALEPAWLAPEVVTLAGSIYDAGAFDRLPELADALQEAGCTDASLLAHLRAEDVRHSTELAKAMHGRQPPGTPSCRGSPCKGLLGPGPRAGESMIGRCTREPGGA